MGRIERFFENARAILSGWVLFSLVFVMTGIHAFATAPVAKAVTEFSMKTGYYMGTGTSLTVSGLGFQPEVLLLKADTIVNSLLLKTSAMAASVTAYLGAGTADNTEGMITFTSDGFTLSGHAEVNTSGTRYLWIAFDGSDCTSEGTMCVGSYTGNSSSTQAITSVGFQPDMVIAKRSTTTTASFRTSDMSPNHAALFQASANDTTGTYFQTLDATGFTVGATNNIVGGNYYFIAFKDLANKFITGTFTGNGVDNRSITGVGFRPDFVLVKQNAALAAAFSTTETWGDNSSFASAAAAAPNNIQDLEADGFQVGTSTNVNANGVTSHYFAFGGAPDPAPSGGFYMARGSYIGNGTSQSIDTTFRPDLVIIKAESTGLAVFSTSMDANLTHYFATNTTSFANAITSMDATGFTVGTSTTVNSNLLNFEWMAFGNATTPHRGAGAANFVIGTYTGNGIARSITNLGFDPDMVTIKRNGGSLGVWKAASPVMADGTTAFFSATADDATAAYINTLTSDGFTIGTNAAVNTAAAVNYFFAFKEGAQFDVGSYTGDGVDGRSVTGLGFDPDLVWVKRTTAVGGIHRSSSATITGAKAQYFPVTANATNLITSLTTDGFTVGTAAETNANTGSYRYAAWQRTTTANPPDTPTNSTPADAATAQDLNVVLTASAYADDDLDAHVASLWQVDDDSDFSSPEWARTSGSAEVTTTVNTTNGTFANDLSGKTELDHNTTYYWRVKYSDGVYGSYSTATSFTTNIISTPTHTSPAANEVVTTLTPTLIASAFSDAQAGHTAQSAQWQISTSTSFSSPMHDTGAIAYDNEYTVPSSVLSDRTSYYWRVRYQDSSDQWSEYSTATRFATSASELRVTGLFGSTVVDQGDAVKIDAQVALSTGVTINDATATISIYNPSGTKIVDGQAMSYVTGSGGVYRYAYTVPSANGSYLYEVTAVSDGVTGYGAGNFEVRTIQADVTDIATDLAAHEAAQDAERAAQAAERAAQAAERLAQDASRDVVDAIQTTVTSTASNMDVLVGAMIVTQSTVNDEAATTTSFVTNLSNATDDFYKNAVITFTSGALDGQNRRISAYNGTTKAITVDPALTSAPANGVGFTIVTQNVRVEEQVASHEAAESAFRTDTTNRLIAIEDKIDAITTTLNAVDTDLSSVQTTVNNLRASQVLNREVVLADVSEVQPGTEYRTTLTVQDYESDPVAPDAAPQITILDSTGATIQAATPMTLASTGVYTFALTLDDEAVSGLWESIVTVDVGGDTDVTRKDYFQVTGSPAQVLINSISDLTVPTVAAAVTITNEGTAAYEYQYEWCVVTAQDNPCGGGDDVYYGSAAKLLTSGENWNTTLNATVPAVGTYYFKLVVYYGTEASGASLQFTAVEESDEETPAPSSSNGSGSTCCADLYVPTPVGEDPGSDYAQMRRELAASSRKLELVLASLSMISPGVEELLAVNAGQTQSLKEIQNKVSDLRAVSSATRQIVERKASEPIVHTYMKFNSVVISFLITNPTNAAQTLKFKAFLPEEARPEYVMDAQGLKVDYDTEAKLYFVSGDIELGPSETVTREVELKDIWVFDKEELAQLKSQAASMLPVLAGTQFEAQGILLKNDIDDTVNLIIRTQDGSYTTPQDHIVAYRDNLPRMERVRGEFAKLKDLVVQAGAARSVVGQVGGIQTFATWGIILAIVFGFALLAAVIFAMWRHQTMLAAAAMGLRKEDMDAFLGKQPKRLPPPKASRVRRRKAEAEPIDLPPPPETEPPPM